MSADLALSVAPSSAAAPSNTYRCRSVNLANLGPSSAGNITATSIAGGFTEQYVSASPVSLDSYHWFHTASVMSGTYGTSATNFAQPFSWTFRFSSNGLITGLTLGFYAGSASGGTDTTADLAASGLGLKVVDNNTLQLQIFTGGQLYTQNFTVTGFIDSSLTSGKAGSQLVTLNWNGVDTLSLYASFTPSTGGRMAAPAFIGKLVQAASGFMNDEGWRWGMYGAAATIYTTQPSLVVNNMVIEEL